MIVKVNMIVQTLWKCFFYVNRFESRLNSALSCLTRCVFDSRILNIVSRILYFPPIFHIDIIISVSFLNRKILPVIKFRYTQPIFNERNTRVCILISVLNNNSSDTNHLRWDLFFLPKWLMQLWPSSVQVIFQKKDGERKKNEHERKKSPVIPPGSGFWHNDLCRSDEFDSNLFVWRLSRVITSADISDSQQTAVSH